LPDRQWKIIIADDEEDVHAMTRMVLSDYMFENQGVQLLSAFSGTQTLELMHQHPDTAVILLDVVMESDDAGLKAVENIRKEMNNPFVRIILRTGQAGKAPETQVISKYDINDYKEKTELTAQKLYTSITSSLRTYRDMRIIDQNKRGLEKIIEASARLFEVRSLQKFAQGVLMQLVSIFQLDENNALFIGSAFTASQLENTGFSIIAGTGKYHGCIGEQIQDVVSGRVMDILARAIESGTSFFLEDMFVRCFITHKNMRYLLYLKGCRKLTTVDKNLIRVFASNAAIAFENLSLNQEILDTQKEIIFRLGEVIECRSTETGNHVRRVAELSYRMALDAGLSERRAALLQLASPMHDIGKVGIPDAVLLKKGKLTRAEFEVIKDHTEIGYSILKNSRREILETGVIVARQHHEHWDGKGYPLGLRGEQIHIFGRITAIADVFDALLHKRVYKEAWPPDRVLDYFRENRGGYFDPRLVDILLEHSKTYLAMNLACPDTAKKKLIPDAGSFDVSDAV
jgi:response regulator RpfG family c-di-GMP phosphodiesterase